MSFLPAVQRKIQNRRTDDVLRLTLDYLTQHAVGHQNPIPLDRIVAHLQAQGVNITNTGFQQSVLATSSQEVPTITSVLVAGDIF